MSKPIYHAPIKERMEDLIRIAQSAIVHLDTLRARDYWHYVDAKSMERGGLREGEFAIGNWIVRPRFKYIKEGE